MCDFEKIKCFSSGGNDYYQILKDRKKVIYSINHDLNDEREIDECLVSFRIDKI